MTRAVDVASRELPPNTALGTRNLIINGDMRIAQRGTSATGITGTGYNTVDRFIQITISAGTWTQTQDTDFPIGQGFANSLKIECTTARTSYLSTEAVILATRIEGQNLQHLLAGTSNAKKFTVSFWVKSNKTGTYILEIKDDTNTRSISKSYTINLANTWEKKTITIDGDTVGAIDNDNSSGYAVYFWLAAGPDWTSGTLQTSWDSQVAANRAVGISDIADTIGNYVNITGVQLEVGEEATEFEHRPYDMELARCQRYFQKFDGVNCIDGQFYSSTVARFHVQLNPSMRTAPTGTWDGTLTASVEEVGVAFRDPTAYSVNGGSTNSYTFNATGMSGATPSKQAMFRGNLIALSLSAEL